MWHSTIRLGLLWIFYPCLMIFGTIGNVLTLKILLRKRFRRQSTCQYLCILAVIDILFIYTRSTRYLYRHIFDVDLRNTSLWICRIFIFFSSSLSHSASWILVIVSFDRYFIMKNLFARRNAGSRVIRSTSILFVIIFILNSHFLYILGRQVVLTNSTMNNSIETYRFVCIPDIPFQHFFRWYLPTFDLLSVALLPFILMIIANVGIIRIAMRSNVLFSTSKKQKRNNRLTIMLLSVIFAFILLQCPSVIFICINRFSSSPKFSDSKLVLIDLSEALWYTKHAINFILYTLSGQDFRREFRKLIPCSRRASTTSSRDENRRRRRRRSQKFHLDNRNSFISSDQTPTLPGGLTDFTEKQFQYIFDSSFQQENHNDLTLVTEQCQ